MEQYGILHNVSPLGAFQNLRMYGLDSPLVQLRTPFICTHTTTACGFQLLV